MKLTIRFTLFIILFSSYSCKKDDIKDIDEQNIEENNEEKPVIPVPDPEKALLIYPEKNTECTEGLILDDNWSTVSFKWNKAQNTDEYNIRLTNIKDASVISKSTMDTIINIDIKRGSQYKWYVISKAENTTKTSVSPVWSFYNTGLGENNYAPFPATLFFPEDKHSLVQGEDYYFRWTGSDLDDESLFYELYLGTHLDSLALVETLTETKTPIFRYAKNDIWHFWKIHTRDPKGNVSISETRSFVRY